MNAETYYLKSSQYRTHKRILRKNGKSVGIFYKLRFVIKISLLINIITEYILQPHHIKLCNNKMSDFFTTSLKTKHSQKTYNFVKLTTYKTGI